MRDWDIEQIWAVLLLTLFAMGGYVPVLMNGLNAAGSQFQYNTAASNPVSRMVIAAMWLGTLVPALRIWTQLRRYGFVLRPLLPYIFLAVASIAWSQDAGVSLRKLLSFLLTCIFGLYFAVRFPIQKQLRIILVCTSLLAVLSIVLIELAPQYALDHGQHAGAWQGVFQGKNACAMVMIIGIAAAMVYRPVSVLTRIGQIAVMVVFTLVIHMADSSGALVKIAILWIAVPLLSHLAHYESKTRALVSVLLFVGTVVTATFTVAYLPLILRLLNRDATLTGRTDLWKAVLLSIFKHPLLGYGYGAFWLGLRGESANVVLAVKWAVPHAHNGYLDIWLSLGAAGLVLFGFALARALRRIWQVLLAEDLRQNLWFISVVLLTLTYNLDESVLIITPSLMWILFVSAVCGLELHAYKQARFADSPNSISDSIYRYRPAMGPFPDRAIHPAI
jgi:exopolysaccharide production protein ExoQ